MAIDGYIHEIVAGPKGGPLLFAFHGTGADEHQLFGLGRQLLPEATVVAPRGDVSEFGAARFFRRTGEGVYDREDLAQRTSAMAGFVAAHRQAAAPAATIGIGYSNGANILASVMFARPEIFDAAVLMHPLIPFEPDFAGTLETRRVLITAGRRDPICPAPLTQQLADALGRAGAEVETVWHEGGHEARPEEFEAARQFLAPWRD